jgi:hypothetical protein
MGPFQRPGQWQAGKVSKRCRILKVKGQLVVAHLPLLLEQRRRNTARRQASAFGLRGPWRRKSAATRLTSARCRSRYYEIALNSQPI